MARRRLGASWLGVALVALVAAPAAAGTKVLSSWASPTLETAALTKVLVIARITEDATRRLLEDALARELGKRKVPALASYVALSAEEMRDAAAIRRVAEAQGVDAALLFTVTRSGQSVQQSPSVSAGVAIPIRIGSFGFSLGVSQPLGVGATTVRTAEVKGELYHAGAEGPQWIGTYAVTHDDGAAQRAAEALAKTSVKALDKAGALR
jgi:hypothetical protein